MRYLKVLLLAIFIFLALVFFFQNQGPLSQEMQLKLNLFFIPTMTSITLPFYFLVVSAFFVGCVLALLLLIWDKLHTSARLMKATWHNGSLQKQVAKIQKHADDLQKHADALERQVQETKAIEAPKTDTKEPAKVDTSGNKNTLAPQQDEENTSVAEAAK